MTDVSGTIAENLAASFSSVPEQTALVLLHSSQPEQIIHYRDLESGSSAYAQLLERAGIASGEVVILILPHGKDLIFSFFGTILHGAVPSIMPFLTEKLSADQYRASLAALFEITAPAAVITYPEFVSEVNQAASEAASIRAVLVSNQVADHSANSSRDFQGLQRSPSDIALLQHSSGTTGLQKGVALSHTAIFNQLTHYSEAIQLTSQDVIVSWLPLYHDMGLISSFLMPILLRCPLILISPFDWVRAPVRLLQAVSTYHGTLTWLPNFAYNFCSQKIRSRELEGVDLSSWRAVINCSEPMHRKSHSMFLERFQAFGLKPSALATCYAMAENVFAVTQGGINQTVKIDHINTATYTSQQIAEQVAPDHPQALPMLSAGRPISGTNLRVVDPQGKDLPERQIGELAIHSDCMLSGYYRRPDLTEKAFMDGWYLTGDLGYLAGGEVYVTGRKKDLIIVGGKNIYPQDIERLVNEVPGVHPGRVAAFGIFDEQAGTEEVVVIAEMDQSKQSSQNDLLDVWDQAAGQLAAEIRQKVNHGSDIVLRAAHIVEKDWLIKTSSGKIARSANRTKYLAEMAEEN
ncbi:MAG TPA: AMP-binding protein [Anaerolineales bacterium]|nr:AMP-binding protein [Anaerolineales bacterium]